MMVILTASAVTEWPLEKLTVAAGYFDGGAAVKTDQNVREMKEAGIDLLIHGHNGDKATLDLFEKHHIKTILNDTAHKVVHPGKGRQREAYPPSYYDNGRAKFVDHPAVVGIDMGDEPSALDADYFGEVAARVSELYPGKYPYMNLYPNYASVMSLTRSEADSQLGTKTYREYLEYFSTKCPHNYICFDFYLYSASQSDRARQLGKYWENFEDVSDICRRTGRQLCVWLLSGSHWRYANQPTTENQLRFQAFSAMAYGTKLIAWGCYAGGWWTNQVLRADGTKSGQYERLKKINGEIHALAGTYDRLRCVNTHHVTTNQLDTGFFMGLKSVSGSELVVGEFVGNTPSDPWRGLVIMAADDPFDTNSVEQVVSFKSFYPVEVRKPSGLVECAPAADGTISLKLRSNEAAIVTTRLTASDVAPYDLRKPDRFCISGSALVPAWRKGVGCERDIADFQELGLEQGGATVGSRDPKILKPRALMYLGWCKKHGVNLELSVTGRWFGGNPLYKRGTMRELMPMSRFDRIIEAIRRDYDDPNFGAIDFCDEPHVLDLPYIGEVIARFTNAGTKALPYINLYPNYASVSWNSDSVQKSQLGTKTYAEYIDAYCRYVPNDYISYDHYPYGDAVKLTLEQGQKRWYDNLEDVARAARRTGRDLWVIGQVNTKPKNVKWLTENQLRFQICSSLAYGATTYSFGTIHSSWWTNCVVQLDGTRTEHFEKVRRLVAEMKYIRGDYTRYRNVNTVLLGFPERGKIAEFSNGFFQNVRAADGTKLAVGDMVARDTLLRKRALYVFAANDMMDQKRQTHEIRFKCYGENVSVKGPHGVLPLRRLVTGEYAFTLKDCEGALVQIDN